MIAASALGRIERRIPDGELECTVGLLFRFDGEIAHAHGRRSAYGIGRRIWGANRTVGPATPLPGSPTRCLLHHRLAPVEQQGDQHQQNEKPIHA